MDLEIALNQHAPTVIYGTVAVLFIFNGFLLILLRRSNTSNSNLRVRCSELKFDAQEAYRSAREKVEKEYSKALGKLDEDKQELRGDQDVLDIEKAEWDRTKKNFHEDTKRELENELTEARQNLADEKRAHAQSVEDWTRSRARIEEEIADTLREEIKEEVTVELERAFKNKKACKPCHGTGKIPSDYYECDMCKGDGYIQVWEDNQPA